MTQATGRLLFAAEQNKTADALAQIALGADIDAQDEFGFTALIWAVRQDNLMLAQALLALRPELEITDAKGMTALLWAVRQRNPESVEALLQAGVNPRHENHNRASALHLAAAGGDAGILTSLLRRDVAHDSPDRWNDTPLTLAALGGHYTTMLILADRGANINARGNNGRTALILAVMNRESGTETNAAVDRRAAIESLLARGADLNLADSGGWTPLIASAMGGDEAICALLLERGADIAARDSQGLTAFGWAARGKYIAVMRLLLEQGADINSVGNRGGSTLLHQMRNPDRDVTAFLLENGVDTTLKDDTGTSALLAAVRKDRLDCVQLLLSYGADLNVRDTHGETPLDYALRNGMDSLADCLLALDAQSSRSLLSRLCLTPETIDRPDSQGWTPLTAAARDGKIGRVRLLCRAGADPSGVAVHGMTPLMVAAQGTGEGIMEALLDWGADPEARDANGVTALYYAVKGQRIERVRVLLAHGISLWASDSRGRTARIVAKEENLPEIANLLRRAESRQHRPAADVALQSPPLSRDEMGQDGDIFQAALCGNIRAVLDCLTAGIPLHRRNPSGATVLMFAAVGGHGALVSLLLARGASPYARDDSGATALDWAERHKRDEVCRRLEDAMGIVHIDAYTGAPDGFW